MITNKQVRILDEGLPLVSEQLTLPTSVTNVYDIRDANGRLVIGTNIGIWYSDDNGNTWIQATFDFHGIYTGNNIAYRVDGRIVYNLTDCSDSGCMFAILWGCKSDDNSATYRCVLIKSIDRGATWTESYYGIPGLTSSDLIYKVYSIKLIKDNLLGPDNLPPTDNTFLVYAKQSDTTTNANINVVDLNFNPIYNTVNDFTNIPITTSSMNMYSYTYPNIAPMIVIPDSQNKSSSLEYTPIRLLYNSIENDGYFKLLKADKSGYKTIEEYIHVHDSLFISDPDINKSFTLTYEDTRLYYIYNNDTDSITLKDLGSTFYANFSDNGAKLLKLNGNRIAVFTSKGLWCIEYNSPDDFKNNTFKRYKVTTNLSFNREEHHEPAACFNANNNIMFYSTDNATLYRARAISSKLVTKKDIKEYITNFKEYVQSLKNSSSS